jgi:hypothetical protein
MKTEESRETHNENVGETQNENARKSQNENTGETHNENVVKNLSVEAKEIEEIGKKYSELNSDVKQLKKRWYRELIYKILFKILENDKIRHLLKEQIENFIELVEDTISKIQ